MAALEIFGGISGGISGEARFGRSEARIGLAVAIAAHVALVALIVLRPPMAAVLPPPERMTVTISDEVGLTSTSPEPQARPAPDLAPELGEPPAPEPVPLVRLETPLPQPSPQPLPRPAPRATPAPKPTAKPSAKPSPQPSSKPSTRPGGSRIGDDFLKGAPGAKSAGTSRNQPAAAIGPAVRSALSGAISRQIKPKWAAPQGAEAELLVTVLAWSLNPDGTLADAPRVVRQDGITDANRPQASRHAEQAVRAVQLAAPFDLPPEYYDAWKRVSSFRFDKRLSQ